MRYILGLDVGIASVGWSVLNIDRYKIEDLCVRTFPKAEQPDGKSLGAPRRLAKGKRRTTSRKAKRMSEIKQLISDSKIMKLSEIEKLYNNGRHLEDIWDVRCKALDQLVSEEDLTRILIHIAKRRGFKSNKRVPAKEDQAKDEKGLKGAISENRKLMISNGYRTVGEMVSKDIKFNNVDGEVHKSRRNKNATFNCSMSREMLIEELQEIFIRQREYGNTYTTPEFEKKYLEIFSRQKPFATKKDLLKLVGKCTFERKSGLKRAAKASYTFCYFNMLQKINAQKIREVNKLRHFSEQERKVLVDYLLHNFEVNYYEVRELLNLSNESHFVGVNYKKDLDYASEKKTKLISMKFLKDIYHAIGESHELFDNTEAMKSKIDDIGHELTYCKNVDELHRELIKLKVPSDIIESVSDLSYSGACNLSLVAMRKIIPQLEKGLLYHEACENVGYDFRALGQGNKQILLPLPEAEDITNPVVKRSISQTRKVINAIIRRYGSPYRIHIETARELAKNFEDRETIKKYQEENRKRNEKVIEKIKELFGFEPKGQDIIKFRLFEEQDGKCVYSRSPININLLFSDPNYTEVDHILPYSRSFDDSYANKVLVKTAENRNKGNRTPYEYLQKNDEEWNEYETWINGMFPRMAKNKKKKILNKSFSSEDSKGMRERSLIDTQYAARFLANFIKENLIFELDDPKRVKVMSVNGRMTGYLRKRWGLSKNRDEGDKHHALDATIVAGTSFEMIREISRISKMDELKYVEKMESFVDPETGEILDQKMFEGYNRHIHKFKLPEPWEGFRQELEARLSNSPKEHMEYFKPFTYTSEEINKLEPIFVSRAPNRTVSGAAHEETIRSPKLLESGLSIAKVKLEKITFDQNGDFSMYNKEFDLQVYNAIKSRYLENDRNKKVAFKEPLFKLKSDGTPNSVIKKVKIVDTQKSGVIINSGEGIANNDAMPRVDVFVKNNKFYLVPIYVADFSKKNLPNQFVTPNKMRKDWGTIDESFDFLFSLYKGDLVRIKNKKGVSCKGAHGSQLYPEIYGYFGGLDVGTMGITVNAHDSSWKARSIGTRNLDEFEKWQVDVLGRKSKVKKEKRLGI